MTHFRCLLLLIVSALLVAGCQQGADEPLVVYSGRSQALVEPIIEQFQRDTGIQVAVRYGETAQLANTLREEGTQTDADLFWAQDAGALGATHAAGLLATLPDSILMRTSAGYRNGAGTWIAVSGRARTLAYAPGRVDTSALPQSIFDLTDPAYAGRVGWPPANGSFQAQVTALRKLVGDDSTRAWLAAMQDNSAESYISNSAVVRAVAAGEIDLGLTNHYYLLRFQDEDPYFPVEQTFFEPGNPGNLVNVAGVGIIRSSTDSTRVLRLVDYLLSRPAQEYFANEVFEYPVTTDVTPKTDMPALDRLEEMRPPLDLDRLSDLDATLQMMRSVGVL